MIRRKTQNIASSIFEEEEDDYNLIASQLEKQRRLKMKESSEN